MLDEQALEAACAELAERMARGYRPTAVTDIYEFAKQMLKYARDQVEFIQGQERDSNIITRAIRYLSYTHAIPVMGFNLEWFEAALTVLIELAVPNTRATEDNEEFYRDIEAGIAIARSDYE